LVARHHELRRWPTAVNVKLLLPPRQSRGNSHKGLAINPIPDVKVAITHMIAENTAIAQIIEGRTWFWIPDHELIADSQSVAKSFPWISCHCVGTNDRAQHEEGNDDFHDAISMSRVLTRPHGVNRSEKIHKWYASHWGQNDLCDGRGRSQEKIIRICDVACWKTISISFALVRSLNDRGRRSFTLNMTRRPAYSRTHYFRNNFLLQTEYRSHGLFTMTPQSGIEASPDLLQLLWRWSSIEIGNSDVARATRYGFSGGTNIFVWLWGSSPLIDAERFIEALIRNQCIRNQLRYVDGNFAVFAGLACPSRRSKMGLPKWDRCCRHIRPAPPLGTIHYRWATAIEKSSAFIRIAAPFSGTEADDMGHHGRFTCRGFRKVRMWTRKRRRLSLLISP
jgi:hypothetical protein